MKHCNKHSKPLNNVTEIQKKKKKKTEREAWMDSNGQD